MRRLAPVIAVAVAACSAAPTLEEARLASPSPEIASCAGWFQALDREVAAAGVRDLEYSPVPGFPYLRVDAFLSQSRARASRRDAAFAAFADRLLEHDLEARHYEIDNLPPAIVEKWSGMRLDDSRSAALRRSVQCGRLLREVELARPDMRSALLARAAAEPSRAAVSACRDSAAGEGALVRYTPPPPAAPREEVRGWLLRGEQDPLGQPRISESELKAIAAAYAPSLAIVVASDRDRPGARRRRRGAAAPEIDATEPAVYVAASYARYEERALLQIVYTVLFPENRITWRVTLAPDGEPLVYDALGADGCRAMVLTPRARPRRPSGEPLRRLPRLQEGERPLVAVAPDTHRLRVLGIVRGSDSLVRYRLRRYDELRSAPTLGGRPRVAAGRPALAGGEPLEAGLLFDLPEPRP